MALAVLGGPIAAIKPIVDLYREAGQRAGHSLSNLKVAINRHAYLGEDAQQAREFHQNRRENSFQHLRNEPDSEM
jgi:alkanesulfonate monooxygenase SsuD/methylene tetrahydromethanopterin reductase-like flavin-dependent oxidoreductase (luciferase family)